MIIPKREVYECLTLERQSAGPMSPAGSADIRRIDRTELSRFSELPEYEISRKFLQGIASRDDVCFGAFVDGELASYVFFAARSPTAIDDWLHFQFAEGWTYVYKAFTLPRWRGKGLLPLLLSRAMAELATAQGRGFVTLYLRGNVASRNAFLRCGFQPQLHFPVWKWLSRPRHVGYAARGAPFGVGLASARVS